MLVEGSDTPLDGISHMVQIVLYGLLVHMVEDGARRSGSSADDGSETFVFDESI